MNSIRILNIDILSIRKQELLEQLGKGVLITPNVDHLVKLQKDREFYEVYQKAEWVVCDSNIVCRASRFLKHPIPEAIPGSSFFTDYYMYHKEDPDCRIFLLGAAEGIAQKARDNINVKTGRDIVVGAHSPSYGFEKNEIECQELVKLVNESGATVLLVGAGAPKQEKWAYSHWNELNIRCHVGTIGAVFDFFAGTYERAPRWWQEHSLEWLYRLVKEPRRMWRRYVIGNPLFLLNVRREKNA